MSFVVVARAAVSAAHAGLEMRRHMDNTICSKGLCQIREQGDPPMAHCCNPIAAAAAATAVSRMVVVVVKYRFLRGLLLLEWSMTRLHSDSLKTPAKTIPAAAECASPRAVAPYCCRRGLAVISAGKDRRPVAVSVKCHHCFYARGPARSRFPFIDFAAALMPSPYYFLSFSLYFSGIRSAEKDRQHVDATFSVSEVEAQEPPQSPSRSSD